MNKGEVNRQHNNPQYYTKFNHDTSSSIHTNVLRCIGALSKGKGNMLDEFDIVVGRCT
jgi:hypothetical protein